MSNQGADVRTAWSKDRAKLAGARALRNLASSPIVAPTFNTIEATQQLRNMVGTIFQNILWRHRAATDKVPFRCAKQSEWGICK